ncbi:MAG: membrane or secreted protein [Flammeovirgaceae bacterium]|nr:membrane or secreted protein [Flammeovirgaceae bacterium]HCX20629.1 membrane or secreted protein [Cytophagales bacterium]|tara:strand:+ start:732 stop:1439 length:708 start_codon:yes stop_codon:yes gene_type:complete
MKKLLIVPFLFLSSVLYAQSPIGAWEGEFEGSSGEKQRGVVIFADGYQVIAVYNAETGAFVSTNGGKWRLEGNTMTETVEFDTKTPERVGSDVTFDIIITDSTLAIVGSSMFLRRIDNGTPGQLQGAWLMSGRVRDGASQTRDTSGPRKTMKLLSGTRFQWIAYNTETKEFMGTGGGIYTTENGKYTENIEFFSRDNSRVGASLSFDYELIDGNWHHKGLSSKGDLIHEIWSVRY